MRLRHCGLQLGAANGQDPHFGDYGWQWSSTANASSFIDRREDEGKAMR